MDTERSDSTTIRIDPAVRDMINDRRDSDQTQSAYIRAVIEELDRTEEIATRFDAFGERFDEFTERVNDLERQHATIPEDTATLFEQRFR